MKPTSHIRWTRSRVDPLGHTVEEGLWMLEQWWEHDDINEPTNKHGGEWKLVELEKFDGGDPPEGWKHPGFGDLL